MKRIVSLLIIFTMMFNTVAFANNANPISEVAKQGLFHLDKEMYRNEHNIENPEILLIVKPNGDVYYDKAKNEAALKKGANSLKESDFTTQEIYIDNGTTRIVMGSASVSSWVTKESLSKRFWSLLKGLTLAVIGFKIAPIGGFIIGAGDSIISNAVSSAHEVSSVSQYNNRTSKKIAEVYQYGTWKKQAEFQKREEFWQKYTYTYDSLGNETNTFRYVSYPGASGDVILPTTPVNSQENQYYSNDSMISSIAYELWTLGWGYTVYAYNASGYKSVSNASWWQNYVDSKTISNP